jgi:ATP-dependent Lhr-like helicase
MAQQLLNRYGVLTREVAAAENLPGGFSAVYDVLKALEESGRVRRGYFVAGLGATQFAMPAALDLLRSLRSGVEPEKTEMVAMAATDPANPYGSVLKWPDTDESEPTRMLSRSVGASVILRNGALVAYLRRGNPSVQVFLPPEEPMRSNTARDFANYLVEIGQREMRRDERGRGGLLVTTINGAPVAEHFLARFLIDAGFQPGAMGFNLRRVLLPVGTVSEGKELQ